MLSIRCRRASAKLILINYFLPPTKKTYFWVHCEEWWHMPVQKHLTFVYFEGIKNSDLSILWVLVCIMIQYRSDAWWYRYSSYLCAFGWRIIMTIYIILSIMICRFLEQFSTEIYSSWFVFLNHNFCSPRSVFKLHIHLEVPQLPLLTRQFFVRQFNIGS